MANNDGSDLDLGTKFRHLKNTHPDEIFGVLSGRIKEISTHERLASTILGTAIGTLALDAQWTDDEVLALCWSILQQVRVAVTDPVALEKLREAAAAMNNAKAAG